MGGGGGEGGGGIGNIFTPLYVLNRPVFQHWENKIKI